MVRQTLEHFMDRLEKLRNDVYSFAELDTLEKYAKKLVQKCKKSVQLCIKLV